MDYSESNAKFNPVTLITGVRYNASLIKGFNCVTFLYDPNWEYTDSPTYPIAFFHVRNMKETMESEVSSKPMLFYNSDRGTSDGTKAGLMNIVSDNIIIKPKTYSMDIVIPANGTSFDGFLYSSETMYGVNKLYNDGVRDWRLQNAQNDFDSFIVKGFTGIADVEGEMFRKTNGTLQIVNALVKALYGASVSPNTITSLISQTQDYNKASLEQMWKGRRFVRLKMWTGWKFKDLVIQSLNIDKNGEDENYYTGTLTCTEVPILTFRQKQDISVNKSFSASLGTAQKIAVGAFIKAMEG